VCLVGRSGGDPERTTFGLTGDHHASGSSYREVRWATNARTLRELPDEVQAGVAGHQPLLITAALGSGIAQAAPLIEELASARPPAAETVLLACENDPGSEYEALAGRHADRLTYSSCLVDRICGWPSSGQRDHAQRRVVVHNATGEWIIPVVGPCPAVLARLRRAPLVRVLNGRIDGWKARKLWIVNGLHIVLALIARRAGVERLPLTGNLQQAFVQSVRSLVEPIAAGVRHAFPDVPVDDAYVEQRIGAFCESSDTTRRLLGDHLVRADLRTFMERLDRRIGDAARAAHRAGQDCGPFADVMALVITALAEPAVYYPGSGQAPTEAIDADVVARFAAVLRGWADAAEAAALRRELGRVLRLSRPAEARPPSRWRVLRAGRGLALPGSAIGPPATPAWAGAQ
jgi:hypothetical protein